jgi:hypothetical protein
VPLVKTHPFEEGAAGAAIVAGGDYLQSVGTNRYIAPGHHGSSRAYESVNGGYVTVAAPADQHSGSSLVQIAAWSAGAGRLVTLTDAANIFAGMIRAHNTGLFDICDNTSTRQAVSAAGWVAGPGVYDVNWQVGGAGLARTLWARIYEYATRTLVWDSGPVAVTAGSSSPIARVRVGAQGMTGGTVITDQVRLYDALEWPAQNPRPWGGWGVPI